jgi:hypothetical protein
MRTQLTPEQFVRKCQGMTDRGAVRAMIREMEQARTKGEDQRFHKLGELLESMDGYIFTRVRKALS